MSAPIAVSYGTPGSRVALAVAYVSSPEKLWTTMPAGIRFIVRRFSAALAPAAYPAVGCVVTCRKSASVVASESVGAGSGITIRSFQHGAPLNRWHRRSPENICTHDEACRMRGSVHLSVSGRKAWSKGSRRARWLVMPARRMKARLDSSPRRPAPGVSTRVRIGPLEFFVPTSFAFGLK